MFDASCYNWSKDYYHRISLQLFVNGESVEGERFTFARLTPITGSCNSRVRGIWHYVHAISRARLRGAWGRLLSDGARSREGEGKNVDVKSNRSCPSRCRNLSAEVT